MHVPMALTHRPTLSDDLETFNDQLDVYLRGRIGMSVTTYKVLKTVLQILGVSAGIFAMHLGAEPAFIYPLIVLIITGPEAWEAVITNKSEE